MSSTLEPFLKPSRIKTIEALLAVDWLHVGYGCMSSVPESIGLLTQLTNIHLGEDKLLSLPESFGQLTNLMWLDLGTNQLSSLPGSFSQLTKLTWLEIGRNQLSSLPESIGNLSDLVWLSFTDNQISSLPESIGKLTNMKSLWLFNNPITELPQSITRLQYLESFFIECEGIITVQHAPIGITALPCWTSDEKPWTTMKMTFSEAFKKLQLYKYRDENLTNVDPLIGKWKACDRIDISDNKISTLPDNLSLLTDLCELNLANNMFSTFPSAVLEMTWMTSLNISGNSITELPKDITRLTRLSNLVIADANGETSVRSSPAGISSLPCFDLNVGLEKLSVFEEAGAPASSSSSV